MKSMYGFALAFALLSVTGITIHCGDAGSLGTRGRVSVEINKQNVENGETVQFNKDHDPLEIVVWNIGTKALSIDSIRLESGGNADVQLMDLGYELLEENRKIQYGYDQNAPILDMGLFLGLPTELENTSIANETLEFLAIYQPETLEGGTSTFVIDSSDTSNTPFFVTIEPYVKSAKIAVPPNNYTFVNATKANPACTEFTVTNVGTDALRIDGISMKFATDEFTIPNPPNQGTLVYPASSGEGLTELKFKLCYAPMDTPDENQVIIKSNDHSSPSTGIVVRGETQAGQLAVSYADQAAGCMDFTQTINPGEMCTKVVTLLNVGAGAVNVKKPSIEQGGETAYTLAWYVSGGMQDADPPGCGAFQSDEPITGPLYSLSSQRTLDIAVTYTASGAKGINGILGIDYASPTEGREDIPLCGGAPKSDIDLAPPLDSQVTFFALEGERKEKTVVIMNKGNGDLTIRGVKIVKAFPELDPDTFSIKTPVPADTVVPKWGLLPLTVEFDAETEYDEMYLNATLVVTYLDPNSGQDETVDASLKGSKDFEGVDLPVANPGTTDDYADAQAGVAMTLYGSASDGGSFDIYDQGYTWFVSKKPAASKVFLNQSGVGSGVQFIPDVAGEYEFRLVVFSVDDINDLFYFSDEAAVTVQVQP